MNIVLRYVLRLCRIIQYHIRLSILMLHLIFGVSIWMFAMEGYGTSCPNHDEYIYALYLPPLFTPLQAYLGSPSRWRIWQLGSGWSNMFWHTSCALRVLGRHIEKTSKKHEGLSWFSGISKNRFHLGAIQ